MSNQDPSFSDISSQFEAFVDDEIKAPTAPVQPKKAQAQAPKRAADIKDDYYDYSISPSIDSSLVSGMAQPTTVVMKDSEFTNKYHVQWCDETQLGVYLGRGFQLVKGEWVASSYTHALTGVSSSSSDKVRIPVGFHERGETRYNILVFIPKKLFANIRQGEHNYYNDRLTAVDNGFKKASKNAGFKNPDGTH